MLSVIKTGNLDSHTPWFLSQISLLVDCLRASDGDVSKEVNYPWEKIGPDTGKGRIECQADIGDYIIWWRLTILVIGRQWLESIWAARKLLPLKATMLPSYEATSNSSPLLHRAAINGHMDAKRTKILLLGLRRWLYLFYQMPTRIYCRRSGKTSIQQVVFDNLPPKQTFYLESTMRIVKHKVEYVHLL